MAATGREFFTVKTVSEALNGFRPAHVTRLETVALDGAYERVPATDLRALEPLPGFNRSSVDGYAVRAADTYGASDSIPGYLRVAGAVRMGAVASDEVGPGTAVAIPTGGMLPAGADAVVMIEHTAEATDASIEVVRPVAPGENVVRFDEDVAAGAAIAPPGRSLRAQDVALLAAAGIVEVSVHARPRVAILATGDEVVPPDTPVEVVFHFPATLKSPGVRFTCRCRIVRSSRTGTNSGLNSRTSRAMSGCSIRCSSR